MPTLPEILPSAAVPCRVLAAEANGVESSMASSTPPVLVVLEIRMAAVPPNLNAEVRTRGHGVAVTVEVIAVRSDAGAAVEHRASHAPLNVLEVAPVGLLTD